MTTPRGSVGCASRGPSDTITPETLLGPPARGSPQHLSQANNSCVFILFH